jgi:hypothetical protein
MYIYVYIYTYIYKYIDTHTHIYIYIYIYVYIYRECEQNPEVKNIVKKIEDVTNVPKDNYESFQILKYELGQRYTAHHDAVRIICM